MDVRVEPAGPAAASASATTTTTTIVTQTHTGHGVLVGDDASAAVHLVSTQPPTTSTADGETIHTTANHPWLTADRGWVQAGDLRAVEPVVTLNSGTGTVAWMHPVAGQADMYNLTVANDHTSAVGGGQWVVHNDDLPPGSLITEVGQSFVEKIRALGVEVDIGSEQANAYGRFAEANGGTQFWGNSPADTYVWFTNAAKDHTVYEEYQHILRGAARGWTSTSSDQMNLEEAQVKTEVLNHADELGMTTKERQAMQKQADDYMKKYTMKNGGCP